MSIHVDPALVMNVAGLERQIALLEPVVTAALAWRSGDVVASPKHHALLSSALADAVDTYKAKAGIS